jgi:uncharacterized Zn finger protein
MTDDARGNGGVPIKFVVKCEDCGHQAVVGVIVRHGIEPRFHCSVCGGRDPLVEKAPAKKVC